MHRPQLLPSYPKALALLPERVVLVVVVVVERPVVFVIRALVVGVVNEHQEPMKVVVPIQFFESLARMVLSVEQKPIVKEKCLLVG